MPNNSNSRRHKFKTTRTNSNQVSPTVPPQQEPTSNPNSASSQTETPTYAFAPKYQPDNNSQQPTPPVTQQPDSIPQQNYNQSPNFTTRPQSENNNPNNFNNNSKPEYPSDTRPNYQAPQPHIEDNHNLARNLKTNSESFWKRPVVWILVAIVLVAAIGLGLFLWQQPTKKPAPSTHNPKTEKVIHHQKKHESAKKPAKDITKQQKSLQAQKKAIQPKPREWKNSGTYDNMKYDTDDFTIQLNNTAEGVKLVPDANNKPALFIEYTFTNKSKQPLKPADVVSQDLQLKQNNQLLSATTPAHDNHDAQDKLNIAQQNVAPEQKVNTAMMYAIGDTKNTISMFFMDLKNHQLLNTNQPFKL